VLEKLSTAGMFLPMGVVPYMAPDATALGQIFWYTVEGEGQSLDELRAIQDWYLRYSLNAVQGVAEVSSVGGFVREYQIDVDPDRLRAYNLSLGEVFRAVQASNSSVGGKVIHKGGSEYLVRGTGWLRGIEDIRDIVVTERKGVPITVERLGTVQIGPAFRRSVLEKNGREAVGAVIMMRYGENPLAVTGRIKEKIQQLQAGLPQGVRVVPFYDRTGLIHESIDTLKHTLIEEILVASAVILFVLWHAGSAFVICITLPLSVLISFIFMYLLKIPSNIMSLSGIAISIGVLVDAGIVLTENAYHRLHDKFGNKPITGDTRPLIIEACKVVGGPLFFSIIIMLLSFGPIFVLGGMEGKMFNPLAYTKSFALLGTAILGITLVPALLPTFLRGRLKSQDEVWLVRSFVNVYRPMLDYFLRHPDGIVILTGLFMIASLPMFPRSTGLTPKVPWAFYVVAVPFIIGISATLVARHKLVCLGILFVAALGAYSFFKPLGEEFMPPLNELAIMDMPTTSPNVNITQAGDDLKARDAVLRQFPEIHQVVGKSGRAETSTDPAPIDMVETVVSLRPQAWWPKRKMVFEDALAEATVLVREANERGWFKEPPDPNGVTMDAMAKYDKMMRELALQRLREFVPDKGRELARLIREEVVARIRARGKLIALPDEAAWTSLDDKLVRKYARDFDEWILLEDVKRAVRDTVDFLAKKGAINLDKDPNPLAEPESTLTEVVDALRSVAGREKPTFQSRLWEKLEERNDELMKERVKRLNWEIQDRAPGAMIHYILEVALDKARAKEISTEELASFRDSRSGDFGKKLLLWQKSQEDVRLEMDSELQVPGWGNIWTRPIQNRVDMLTTGVRTAVGVKVFTKGNDYKLLHEVSKEIEAVLKNVRGAVDVFAEPVVGENYLEITIDRKKAARYGVKVEDIQNVIEVALGGKEITTTLEERRRFPVRVRYPRDLREDEEQVHNLLVTAGEGMAGGGMEKGKNDAPAAPIKRQIPLSLVADIAIRPGPSMIKTENGLNRNYVQLNVRNRDMVGFVEEAQQVVAAMKLPEGFYVEWSGQFEHQVRAQKTLTIVFPTVIAIIFVILYLTYRDLSDTLMMFLAVPGAIAGGAIFQHIFGYTFSTAVWVGYVACFGLATETGIVMMVYLREAIDRRGGMEGITSAEQIKEAVMEGAVARLRPKLLTEGTMILALIPMLWSTGVGSEFMKPMAAPILGGILVADEVIDILIPVLFYWDRKRRLEKRQAATAAPQPA
jgi:Cu(I)/Ag(I) efflux system membrane protein CusA/SilA